MKPPGNNPSACSPPPKHPPNPGECYDVELKRWMRSSGRRRRVRFVIEMEGEAECIRCVIEDVDQLHQGGDEEAAGIIPRSPDEYLILGLNLMWLLAENRIAEFHTELELLPLRALDHPCIKYAIEFEQALVEGTYNRLINGRKAVPHETYLYFIDLLAETIRDEIADCSGQPYDLASE